MNNLKKGNFFLKLQSYSIFISKLNIFHNCMDNLHIYTKSILCEFLIDLQLHYHTLNNNVKQKKKLMLLSYIHGMNLNIIRISKFLNNTFQNPLLQNCYDNNVKEIKKFIKILNSQILYALIGLMFQLDVIGYIRRVWYRKKSHILYFRLGYSYFNKIFLSKKILLYLSKKRILFFFSVLNDLLRHKVILIRSLQRSSAYKLTGITFHKEIISLKKSKKQKVGGSY